MNHSKYVVVLLLVMMMIIGSSESSSASSNNKNVIPQAFPSRMIGYPMRLKPTQEIMSTLIDFARINKLRAVSIQAVVGSVTKAVLRLANNHHYTTFDSGTYEIVSLVGTISANYNETTKDYSDIIPHIHISISDGKTGQTFGGHLITANVYTTAEIVLNELTDVYFERQVDPETGFDELIIVPRK